MKKLLTVSLFCAALLAGVFAGIVTDAVAQKVMPTITCENTAPPEIVRGRITLARGEYKTGLLSDMSKPTDAEGQALRDWYGSLEKCRQDRISKVQAFSPAAASLRRTLDARNAQIMSNLVTRQISYGIANRQWSNAELDFNRLYANALRTRTLTGGTPGLITPVDDNSIAVPPLNLPPPVSDAERNQMIQQNQATEQRLMDEAMKAQRDSARVTLCPSNPAGVAGGPPPNPVTQPNC